MTGLNYQPRVAKKQNIRHDKPERPIIEKVVNQGLTTIKSPKKRDFSFKKTVRYFSSTINHRSLRLFPSC
jgi:hypothetical protein